MYDYNNQYYRLNEIITDNRLNSLLLMSDIIHTSQIEEIVFDGNNLIFGIQDGNISIVVVDGNEREFNFLAAGDYQIVLSDIPKLYDWILNSLKTLENKITTLKGLNLVKINNKVLDNDIVLTNHDIGSQPAPINFTRTLFTTNEAVNNHYFYNCEINSQYNNPIVLPYGTINFNNIILEVLDITTNYGELKVKYFNYNGSSLSFIIHLESDRASRVSINYNGVY